MLFPFKEEGIKNVLILLKMISFVNIICSFLLKQDLRVQAQAGVHIYSEMRLKIEWVALDKITKLDMLNTTLNFKEKDWVSNSIGGTD